MYAPLLALGLLGSVAGTGMQIAGNQEDQSALANARALEQKQQSVFQQKAAGLVNQSLPQSSEPVEQNQINQGGQNRYNAFKALQSSVVPLVAPNTAPATGNKVVTDSPTGAATARSNASGGAFSDLQARSQGQLGGIGDMQNEQNIKNSGVMGQLGEIGTAAGDQASIYPIEQQVALTQGDRLNGWGSLLSSLGSLAMLGGAVGLGKTAATAASASASASGIFSGGTAIAPLGTLGSTFVPANGWSAISGIGLGL